MQQLMNMFQSFAEYMPCMSCKRKTMWNLCPSWNRNGWTTVTLAKMEKPWKITRAQRQELSWLGQQRKICESYKLYSAERKIYKQRTWPIWLQCVCIGSFQLWNKSSSLCCFSDLCESYCSVEVQWKQMKMKSLTLETLGGSLTRLHYSPVLNKQNLQMNQRVSNSFVQPQDRTGSCIHLPHLLHPFVSSCCSSLLPPSSLLFWLLHHLSHVSSDRTFHPDSLHPLSAWLGCSSQPPSDQSKSHPAGHLNSSSTTVPPSNNKHLLDFSSSLPAWTCVSAVPGETWLSSETLLPRPWLGPNTTCHKEWDLWSNNKKCVYDKLQHLC